MDEMMHLSVSVILRQINGWMGGQMDGLLKRWIDGWMKKESRWMDGSLSGPASTNRWMDEWMGEWIDEGKYLRWTEWGSPWVPSRTCSVFCSGWCERRGCGLDEDRCSCGRTGLHCTDGTVAYLVQLLFRDLLSDRCVVLLQVQNKSQQATFSLVAHLLRQTSLHIRRLRHTEKKRPGEAKPEVDETDSIQNLSGAEDSPRSLRYRHC